MRTYLFFAGTRTALTKAAIESLGNDSERLARFTAFASQHVVFGAHEGPYDDEVSDTLRQGSSIAELFLENTEPPVVEASVAAGNSLHNLCRLEPDAIHRWEQVALSGVFWSGVVPMGPKALELLKPAFLTHKRLEVFDRYLGSTDKKGALIDYNRRTFHELVRQCWLGLIKHVTLHVGTLDPKEHDGHEPEKRRRGVENYLTAIAQELGRRPHCNDDMSLTINVYRIGGRYDFHDRSLVFSCNATEDDWSQPDTTGSGVHWASAFILGRGVASLSDTRGKVSVSRVHPWEAVSVATVEQAAQPKSILLRPGLAELSQVG